MEFIVINFLIGFAVSFLGSIPPGSINLRAIAIAMEKNFRTAVIFSMGTSLAELIYSSLAIIFSAFLVQNPAVKHWITIFSIPVLAGLGIQSLFFSKPPGVVGAQQNRDLAAGNGKSYFAYGVFLGLINPLNVPFWLLWTTTLLSRGAVSAERAAMVFYLIGIVLGGFTLLCTISVISHRAQRRFNFNPQKANQLIGLILIGLAGLNLFNILTR